MSYSIQCKSKEEAEQLSNELKAKNPEIIEIGDNYLLISNKFESIAEQLLEMVKDRKYSTSYSSKYDYQIHFLIAKYKLGVDLNITYTSN